MQPVIETMPLAIPQADQIFYDNAKYWLEHRNASLTVRHGRLKKISKFNLIGRIVKWHKNSYQHGIVDQKVEDLMRDTVNYFRASGRHDFTATLKFHKHPLHFNFSPKDFVKAVHESHEFRDL